MCKKFTTIFLNVLFFNCLLFSCTSKSIHDELEDWCNCEKVSENNSSLLDSCNQLMIDISVKYEFDPEAIPIIKEKVKTCE